MGQERLGRRAASEAVAEAGWQFILGGFETWVAAGSVGEAVGMAAVAAPAGADAGLIVDARAEGLRLRLQDPATGWVGHRQVEAASAISARLRDHGWHPGDGGPARTVQRLEIAIDCLDEDALKGFWRAALDYVDGPDGDLIDPRGIGPSVWFQQMDRPRVERNRVHLDITVPHDLAQARIEAALAAGGTMRSTEFAPSFWVLADAEGNEICVCTWLERDERRDAARAAEDRDAAVGE